jgi:hypothetical protein
MLPFRVPVRFLAQHLTRDGAHGHENAARDGRGIVGQTDGLGQRFGRGVGQALGRVGGGGEELLFVAGVIDLLEQRFLCIFSLVENGDFLGVGIELGLQNPRLIFNVVQEGVVVLDRFLGVVPPRRQA